MLSAGMGKSKEKIVLPPMGTLSQHFVLTDGTYGNKTSQVYTTTKILVPNEERLFFFLLKPVTLCVAVVPFLPAPTLILKLFPWYHG